MYFCKQIEENDCGFACLKMMLANSFKDEGYLVIPQELGKGPYSFADLKEIAEKENLILEGYEIENLFNEKKTLIIGQIVQNEKTHFVYIYKVTKKEVYVFDPAFGKRIIEKEMFQSITTNKYLVVEKIGEHKKLEKEKILPFTYYLSLALIVFLEFFFIFMMSFFTDGFHYEFLIFGLLFLVCLYLQNVIQIAFMKKYDEYDLYPILDCCPNNESKEIKNGIENEYKLKGELFKNNSSITLNASIVGFVGFILLANDLKQVIGIIIILLIALFKKMILEKYNNPLKYQIYSLDRGIEPVKTRLEKADYLSYKYANNLKMSDLVVLIIIATYCVSIALLNNTFITCFYNIVIFKILFDKIEGLLNFKMDKTRFNKYYSYHNSFEKMAKNMQN